MNQTSQPDAENGVGRAPSRPPTPAEFGSMPIDPLYAWSMVLEPAEVLIQQTAAFIEQLAHESYDRDTEFEDSELEQRFLTFFDRLIEEGTLQRLPDADPAMGRQILGPKRWLRAQRIRINRLAEHWRDHGGPPAH